MTGGAPPPAEIRALRGGEAPPALLANLCALEASAFAAPWSAADFAGLPADRWSVLVLADAAGGLLGYALIVQAADEVELLRLAVAPAARRRGLGRALLAGVLAHARDREARALFLEVRAENAPAIALYRAGGLVELGRRRRYYADGDDALLLGLLLGG